MQYDWSNIIEDRTPFLFARELVATLAILGAAYGIFWLIATIAVGVSA